MVPMVGNDIGKMNRSQIMARIRKVNTKPEIIVRKALFKDGFRFRIHVKSLPGCPDIVLKKYNAVVFVNGCFWHAHEGCRLNRMPKVRTEYWVPKIIRNVARDKAAHAALVDKGWKVYTIWECELLKGNIEMTIQLLKDQIRSENEIY
jgi:DNA mismatch endonuclease (patch repair protein)